jgi:trimeric autotransporter adhesin
MGARTRLFPALALPLAAATAIALTVALPGPARAIVSDNPDDPTCETNGRVNAVAYLGGTIYIGGSFTQVRNCGGDPTVVTRNRLAAFDAATGALRTSWNPSANGVVRALKVSPAGTRIYVGGDFSTVGGAVRARVAALSPTSGNAFGWSPYVNDSVKSITTSNSGATVYVGGDFTSAEGAGRRHLAAFNATSGNLTSLKPNVSNGTGNFATVLAMDVSADGDTLYFAGDFALVNGSSRRNAAAVSSGIGTLRAWSPAATADIVGDLTLSSSGRTVFVGGRATGGYVQAYGPTAGGSPVWNVGTNGDVEALAIISSTLYVGGHFTSVAGQGRGHLAALRASGGVLENWNPDANGVFGAFGAAITSSRVAFGGEFTLVDGENTQGVVQFSGAA